MGNRRGPPTRANMEAEVRDLMQTKLTTKSILVLALAVSSCTAVAPGLPLGSEIPRVDLTDATGRRVRLHDFADKPVVLFFYSPACEACKGIVRIADHFLHQEPDQRSAFLLVVRRNRRNAISQSLLSRFTVLYASDRDWAKVFQISATPTLLFYAPDKRLVRKQVGRRTARHQLQAFRVFFGTRHG